jgi:hypothetical protein
LLVAFIPGLLMLATFGLERLEAGLVDDAAADHPVRAPQRNPTAGVEADRAAAAGPSTNGVSRTIVGWAADLDKPALPTRIYVHHQQKTSFQPPRHADRV